MYVGLNKDCVKEVGIGKTCLISKRHAASLEKAIKIIINSGAPVEKIVMYGSCSRECAKYNSDVDLAVILNDDAERYRDALKELRSAASSITSPDVDIHYINTKKYGENNDVYINAVKRDEVVVWKA